MSVGYAPRRSIHLPRLVVAVGFSATVIEQLRGALDGQSELRVGDSITPYPGQRSDLLSSCLLLGVPERDDSELLDAFARWRTRFPDAPTVAVFLRTSSPAAVLKLGRLGVKEIIQRDALSNPSTLRDTISRCFTTGVAARAWRLHAKKAPPVMGSLLHTALLLAHQPFTAVDLARASHVNLRMLRRHCEVAALPNPRWIVSWARLLLAAQYLRESDASIQEVAAALSFSSTNALRTLASRHLGLRIAKDNPYEWHRGLLEAFDRPRLTLNLSAEREPVSLRIVPS